MTDNALVPLTGKEYLDSLDGWTAPDLVNPDDVCILDPQQG